ncbi:non-ribosomal peptide synthetase, partial [Thermoflavimicrobium dichotomicum]
VAVWQQKPEQKERLKKQETYWLEQLAGELPVLELPTDFPRPPVRQFDGEIMNFTVGKEILEKVKALAMREGTTLYMTLLAVYHVLLSKYTGQQDMIIGSPIAGRPHVDLESVVGMFVNTLALRTQSKPGQSFRSFLAQVKQQVLQAYENSDYPFEELVEKLDLQRDLSRQPLFDTMLTMQNMDIAEMDMPSLTIQPYEWEWKNAKFDLHWMIMEREQLHLSVEYSTRLFKRETIERMVKHFVHLLQQVAANPEKSLAEFELVTEEEKEQLLTVFNDTQADYPRDKTIQALFEEQVQRTPDRIAVTCEGKNLTYRELNERANQLARVLRKEGVESESIVGLMFERSLEMIIGILGVLKAGGTYMPIDPAYPAERI